MKSLAIVLSMFLFALLGQMCNNKEEKYEDEELSTEQTTAFALEEAEANWKRFMITADKMIAISETNLKSLESMINQDDNVNGNLKWKMVYNASEKHLNKLKEELESHNDDVVEGIKNSNLLQIRSNRDFPSKFLREIIELNNEMEDIIDE
ncbi:hypothetical protein [Flavobacterium terrisoli]|uniref:hypothetical protein n=1 Tax=Flavobacterium terrisoli TaxID=3242195 RepID=UPI002542FB30|nr:hypothetical protein [Flavobacterium buctense]